MKKFGLMLLFLALPFSASAQNQPQITDVVQLYDTYAADTSDFATAIDSVDSLGKHKTWGWASVRGALVDGDASCDTCRLSVNPRLSPSTEWILLEIPKGWAVPFFTRRIRLGHGTNIPITKLHLIKGYNYMKDTASIR